MDGGAAASLLSDAPSIQTEGDGTKASDETTPPYSFRYECHYFFAKGVPLGLSAFLEWGFPPLFAMIMAGQTQNSQKLQEALGYARVFYNITTLMTLLSFSSYFFAVVPGCLGAGRRDRLPNYLFRSVTLVSAMLLPLAVLNAYAGEFYAAVGVTQEIADSVGTYCKWMIIASFLLMIEVHVEYSFVCLGYARCAAFNSLLTGCGVDMLTSYVFIYHLNLGTLGAALTQIAVKASRLFVWFCLALYYGVWRDLLVTQTREKLISLGETKVFLGQAVPQLLSFFTSWLVFELQIIALAHIPRVPHAAVSAGAIWVNLESMIAAVQKGWLDVTGMRTLALLGRQDRGASSSFVIFCVLGSLLVALSNIPMLLGSSAITRVLSNDPDVRHWLNQIFWVLAIHQQTRLPGINATQLFVPLGKGSLSIWLNIFAFYVIATPICAVIALTDLVTVDVQPKLVMAVALSAIAQLVQALMGGLYLCRADWAALGKIISSRANNDITPSEESRSSAAVTEGEGVAPLQAAALEPQPGE